MRLRIYILTDPRTRKIEQVYEYPSCLASPILLRNGATLVSREPMRIPILIVPNEYLTEREGMRESADLTYGDPELYDYWLDLKEKGIKEEKKSNKLEQLQKMFSPPHTLQYSFKTMFFTGPKDVYKQTFEDKWAYTGADQFVLENRGLFRTVENLSFKGPNEIFITGTFECFCDGGAVVKENTQCKIVFEQKGKQSNNL